MIPYIILLAVPLLVQHIHTRTDTGIDDQKKNKFALFFFLSFLTILVMLRHESVGNDTRNYIYLFERISKSNHIDIRDEYVEIGFYYFVKAVSFITGEARIFLALCALITSAMLYSLYRKLCVDSSLTIALFCTMSVFTMMFSGIRQMLAIGFGCIAYLFVKKKRIISFVLLVILAMSMHTSAFMLFFMYPIYHLRLSKKWLVALVPTVALAFLFNKPIFSFFTSILEKYTRYEGEVSSTGAYTMIILLSLFTVFAFVVPNEDLIDNETIGLRNFLVFSLFIQLFAPLNMTAMRMNYYYLVFIPLLIPKIISCRSNLFDQIARVARHIMVIFFIVYFFYNASRGGNLNVFPYHFFWETVG